MPVLPRLAQARGRLRVPLNHRSLASLRSRAAPLSPPGTLLGAGTPKSPGRTGQGGRPLPKRQHPALGVYREHRDPRGAAQCARAGVQMLRSGGTSHLGDLRVGNGTTDAVGSSGGGRKAFPPHPSRWDTHRWLWGPGLYPT